jgi:hypothetical protein
VKGAKQESVLEAFAADNRVVGKGALSAVLTITRKAMSADFPLKSKDFLAPKKGQVAGLGGGAVKKILKDHGITQILASEGGRTSRGNMDTMSRYIDCLNKLSTAKTLDLRKAEEFWVSRVREYFATLPFKLKRDRGISVRVLVRDVLAQARKRQSQRPGSTIAGTVLQHLVAAKLKCLLGGAAPRPHKASEADTSRSKSADFTVGETAIHVTLTPSEALIEKCASNLSSGLTPVIITLTEAVPQAVLLGETKGIAERLEVWSVEQFVSTNVHERGGFSPSKVSIEIGRLVENYNWVIAELNEEQSLKIEV